MNRRTSGFRQQFERLPERIRDLAKGAFRLFRRDQFHPMLHNHKISPSGSGRHRPGTRSVWINREYRALYVVDEGVNIWYWIGSHADYNTFIGNN